MNIIRRRLDVDRRSEAGLSLVEVIVALLVLAIISTGVAFTMTSVLALTRDSGSRQQAANLAAQEIDLSRSIDNLFGLVDADRDVTVNGTVYHIHRSTQWVSDPSVDQKCGTGGGVLRYKRVNVTVGWDGMRSATATVRADTLIDPGTRLNDPTLGTILVSVTTASGSPSPGVTVTAAPSSTPNGAQALTAAPAPTDAQGCTYILQVVPGNYDVKITKSNFVDVNQLSSPVSTTGVAVSAAASVRLDFDNAGVFPITYAGGAPKLPTNLGTSFLSTYGSYVTTSPNSSVKLYPFTAGYQVLAGNYVDPSLPSGGCASVDPSRWLAGTSGGVVYADGTRPLAVATVPGGTALPTDVSMGVLTVPVPRGQWLTAVSQPTGPTGTGDPGCAVGMVYNFVQQGSSDGTYTIGLPYGSWKIFTGSSVGSTSTVIPTAQMIVLPARQFTPSGDIVTLDPRPVAP